MVLHKRGELDEAIYSYHKALQLNPAFAHAHHNLGVAFAEKGLRNEAITFFQKALQFDPRHSDACFHMGILLKEKGKLDEAITCFQKTLQINPNLAAAYHCLGLIFGENRQFDKAVTNFKRAIELNPNYADAYSNLGKVLHEQGQLDEAMIYLKKAIHLDANHALAYNNLGTVLQGKGRSDEAITLFQKALQLNPEFSDAYYNLGTVLHKKNDLDGAIICFQNAIKLNPGLLDAYNNLGNTLSKLDKLQEAAEIFHKALEINPHYALILNNLGNVVKDQGKLNEAAEYCRRALEIKPDFVEAYSNCLLFMNYDSHNDAQTIFSEHVRLGRQVAEPFTAHTSSYTNDCSPDRKLKIGYVSPDFRRHSVNYFLEPVLASHNHDSFEVFCYSDVMKLQPDPDNVTERLKGYSDRWQDIAGLSDEQAAELIRNDRIDILIDLAGHTGYNRMLLFARKPAPIQVSWLGYPNTTGLVTIDYRIVDLYSDPLGMTDPYYTEKLIRIPDSFLCYMPDLESPEFGDLPALRNEHITFSSFNIFSKVSSFTVTLWSEIMQMIPSARLIIKSKCFSDQATFNYALEIFAKQGLTPERITLLSHVPSYRDHLLIYNNIDIALDTFPYHGTTTTCEAMWMGVPVITLAGKTHASRVGVSLLSNVGLPELIATTPEEYVAKAVDLARALEKLQLLRKSLRDMMSRSPLTDAKKFTHHLEEAYRKMWRNWCMKNE
jgi:predicted O-linked N-acetylglucosamine transferase (SPINDLY family)